MLYLQPKFSVGPPAKSTACEGCVYGGEHAEWCKLPIPIETPGPVCFGGMTVTLDPRQAKDRIAFISPREPIGILPHIMGEPCECPKCEVPE